MVRNLLFLFTFAFLMSCTYEKENDDPYVRVKTSGIYSPVSVSYKGKEISTQINLGEWVTASSPILMTFTIQNNTNFPVTDIDFSFPGQTMNVYNFSLGESEEEEFPGFGGTCQRVLAPLQNCTIILQFYSAKSGEYVQEGLLSYKNLVESASREMVFSVLAGQPASLVFDDGDARSFIFGEEIGTSKTPYLERADRIEYHRHLKIKNTGELSARDIFVDLIPQCSSLTRPEETCPSEYYNPWRLIHTCPSILATGEECTADMYFIPLNQSPADSTSELAKVIERLNYKGDIKVDYKRTPEKSSETSLTGRFETNSVDIKAHFLTSKNGITYNGEVTSGNYKTATFNLRNSGEREGELRKLLFRKSGDISINPAKELIECRYNNDLERISCYEEGASLEALPLALKDFPFIITDNNHCLSHYVEEKTFVEIENSCLFELRFQPSTTYVQPYDFEYDLFVEYDARWKGLETIEETPLFNITGTSIQPALVELFKVEFDGGEESFSATGEELAILYDVDNKINLGRLPLLSPGYEAWRRVTFTYRNIGGVPFSYIRAFVGHETGAHGIMSIPKSNEGGNGLILEKHGYAYYKNIQIDMTNCGSGGSVLPDPDKTGTIPTAFCKVSFQFSPTGLSVESKENDLMYDLIEGFSTMWRIFSFHYHDGSYYSDTNFTAMADLETDNIEALKKSRLALTAKLVASGFLQNYYTSGNFGNIYRGNKAYKEFYFKNIGTGSIPYIPYRGGRLPLESDTQYDLGFRRVLVDPSEYNGSTHDCNDVFDFDAKLDDDLATIQGRIDPLLNPNPLKKLGPLETCVLRVEAKEPQKLFDGVASAHRLLTVPSNVDYDNDILNHMIRLNNGANASREINLSYYDGDGGGQPESSSDIEKALGKLVETDVPGSHLKQPIRIGANFREQMRLVVANPAPYQSAVIYVPSSYYPEFDYQENNGITATRSASTRNAIYFAYENRQTNSTTTCNPTPYMHPSCHSQKYVTAAKLAEIGVAGFDYIIHAGTFPTGKDIPISFNIVNAGDFSGALDKSSETITTTSEFTTLSSYINGQKYGLSTLGTASGPISGGYPISLRFMATNTGRYEWIYQISYNNGRPSDDPDNIATLRIKVVAEALDGFPEAAFATEDFKVETIPNASPVAFHQPDSTVEIEGGFNHTNSSIKALIESVKLKQRTFEASYGQKRFIVKNPSSEYAMTNVRYMFRDSASASTSTTLVNTSVSSSATTKIVDKTCIDGVSLAPGASCYIDLRYQPLDIDQTSTFVLTVTYDTDAIPHQYFQRNLSIEVMPRMPSIIRVENLIEQNINYRKRGEGPTVYSAKAFEAPFAQQIPDGSITYDALDKTVEFTYTLVNNTEDTKASLLKQFEVHKGYNNTNMAPDDPRLDYVGGFLEIYSHESSNGGASIRVHANDVCLFGNLPAGTINEERGFNKSTASDCELKIIYSPGINSIGRTYIFANTEDASELYIPLKYYNNKRSSFDEFNILLTGRVYPDKSALISSVDDAYYDVSTRSDGRINFSWVPMQANNPDVGNIVGYRVYYTRYSSRFGDEIFMVNASSKPDYVDIRGDAIVEFWGDPVPGVYSIYVAAIRYNGDYTAGTFEGLASGEYLSHAEDIKVTKMVVPPNYLQFSYEDKMLVTYDIIGNGDALPKCNNLNICGSNYYNYPGAVNACKALAPVSLINEGQPKNYAYSLATEAAWSFIASDYYATSYRPEEAAKAPHWLQTGLIFDIDEVMYREVGDLYNPSLENYTFDSPFYLNYVKPPSDVCVEFNTCSVPKVMGMLGAESPGYVSYMNPKFPLVHARCFVPLGL